MLIGIVSDVHGLVPRRHLLVIALELLGLVGALLIRVVFKRAVVQSVGVGLDILVEGMIPGISLIGLAASRQHAMGNRLFLLGSWQNIEVLRSKRLSVQAARASR